MPVIAAGWTRVNRAASRSVEWSVDETIGQEVLRVVQPAAVEAAVLASEEEARQQDDVLEAWGRDLEAARYAAQRAQKQYDAADPENRLVADELERRWNQALQRVQEIELRIEQHVHRHGKATTATREEFEDLATELEAVWNCPDTDVRLKKRIVRTLIHEVVVDVDAMRVKSFSSFTGKAACTRSCDCRGVVAVRTAARHRKRSSRP